MQPTQISVIVIKEGSSFTAQCLQYDIAAQGDSITNAMTKLQRTLVSEIVVCEVLNKNCLDSIPPAPDFYWQLFKKESLAIEAKSLPPLRTDSDVPPSFMMSEAPVVRIAA